MAQRKKKAADARKESLKSVYFAKLNDVPTSPRKMRLLADVIRGMEAYRALSALKFSPKDASIRLEKLLRSAIANWEQKNERKAEGGELYVSEIFVDGAGMLKRLRTAPQGRGYRIRKRSNHVTLYVDTIKKEDSNDNQKVAENGTKD
ncbi:MAG: 50S ribosomal protein L22 [Paludibacteraceae bacterium]|jgi:large subunit ribosomal protein L22|nr:50S ribosomal protein L22 [Paludibacteraceae bacterium]